MDRPLLKLNTEGPKNNPGPANRPGPANSPGPENSPGSKNSPSNFSMHATRKHYGFYSTQRCLYIFRDSRPRSWKPGKQIQRLVHICKTCMTEGWAKGKESDKIGDRLLRGEFSGTNHLHQETFTVDQYSTSNVQRNHQTEQLPNGRSRRFRLGRHLLRPLHPSKNYIQKPKSIFVRELRFCYAGNLLSRPSIHERHVHCGQSTRIPWPNLYRQSPFHS